MRRETLDQWFSDLARKQENHLEEVLKPSLLGATTTVSDSVALGPGLIICFLKIFIYIVTFYFILEHGWLRMLC